LFYYDSDRSEDNTALNLSIKRDGEGFPNISTIPSTYLLNFSTFLGDTGYDIGYGVAVDPVGATYITGNIVINSDSNAFITKFNQDSSFNSTILLGVSGYEEGRGIAIDAMGAIYRDDGYGITVDAVGIAYVTGVTHSFNFPTKNAYDSSFNLNDDVFVTKINPDCSLNYSTFLGGSGYESGWGIVVDRSGAFFVTGSSTSSNFPTKNAYDTTSNGEEDVFVTKLNADGTLAYSTYVGGNNWDQGYYIALDTMGAIWVTGFTQSSNFPTQDPLELSNGTYFYAVISSNTSGNSSLSNVVSVLVTISTPNDNTTMTTSEDFTSASTKPDDQLPSNPFQADSFSLSFMAGLIVLGIASTFIRNRKLIRYR
jgi:hypothetical protein